MAVNGACNTAPKTPAIPTKVKLLSDKILVNPRSLNTLANAKPAKPSVIALGAKIPPIPPLSIVRVVATTLRRIMKTRKTKNHTLSLKT